MCPNGCTFLKPLQVIAQLSYRGVDITSLRAAGGVSADTLVMALVDAHIEALEGERAQRTYDTYKYTASKLRKYIVGVRVGDGGLTARMHHAIQSMRQYHGVVMARQARTILRGGFQLAVLAEVIEKNPVIGIEVRSKGNRRPKGPPDCPVRRCVNSSAR